MMAAYWFLVILFLVLSLIFMFLVVGRKRQGSMTFGAKAFCFVPAAVSAGFGISGHPIVAIGISLLVVFFSLWWLNNMAQRQG